MMTRRAPPAAAIVNALEAARVPVLVLRSDEAGMEGQVGYRPVQLLVPPDRRAAARRVLDTLDWRYAWASTPGLALLPGAQAWWDQGPVLEVYWALPAAPFPPQALRRLSHTLWRTATRDAAGLLRPAAAALHVHLAVQSCRPGRGHEADWLAFVAGAADQRINAAAESIAQACGVRPALRRSLDALHEGNRPGPGAVYDGGRDVAWRMLMALQTRVRPLRLRRLMAAAPRYGDVPLRCRVAGIEVVADAGVFFPAPESELFVEAARTAIQGLARPLVVELGTGTGALGLALLRRRSDVRLHATDRSGRAVACARRNARRLGLGDVRLWRGSLLDPLPEDLNGRVDLLMANLPYLPAAHGFSLGSVPAGTLRGQGPDGLGLQRSVARDARRLLRRGGRLQFQMLASQWQAFLPELAALGYEEPRVRGHGAFVVGGVALGSTAISGSRAAVSRS